MAKNMYQKREERRNKKIDNSENQEVFHKTSINWYPGHMAKTKRLIQENINYIDVVYEVIDSRMPYSSKIKDIDNYIKDKKRIIIMTKIDLSDPRETDKWKKYYEKKGYKVFPVNLEKNTGLSDLVSMTNILMEESMQKRIDKGMTKRKPRVLVVGIPNVGKSTLINRLVGKKATTVGNKPGVTKQLNWIRVGEALELLDTPGILWPKLDEEAVAFNLASLTAIKEELLPIDDVVLYILKTLGKYYPNLLKERYDLTDVNEDSFEDALEIIGKKRGCLIRGGCVDYDKVYGIVMNDIKSGSIGKITFDRCLNEQ